MENFIKQIKANFGIIIMNYDIIKVNFKVFITNFSIIRVNYNNLL